MTIAEIKTEIGIRIGDPNLTTYGDRVESYFRGALSDLILATPGLELASIPGLADGVRDIILIEGVLSTPIPASYFKIIDIECQSTATLLFHFDIIAKSPSEWDRDINSTIMSPEGKEIIYTIKNDELLIMASDITFVPKAQFYFVVNPSSYVFPATDFLVSDTVLYACINMAVVNMKKEFKMER